MRGRPFEPGNKLGRGRPAGSRNKSTMALQSMLEERGEAILAKAVLMAIQGDPTALRLCLERLLPPRRNSPVRFKLPPINSAADVARALSKVVQGVANGKLAPADGEKITALLESVQRIIESVDLAKRVGALERQHSEASDDESSQL
jgi:hypothetical protein